MPRKESTPTPPPANGRGPVHSLRHRRIKAAIWRNDTEKGPMYNVTIIRSYKNDGDQWQESHSFGYDDLMNVSALMYEAHAFISSLLASAAKPAKNRADARDIPF